MKSILLPMIGVFTLVCSLKAQVNFNASVNSNASFNLLTGGTSFQGNNYDEEIHHIPIGFNLNINSNIYDSVYVSANSFIWFGNAIGNAGSFYDPLTLTTQGNGNFFVCAFAADCHNNIDAPTSDWSYLLTGTAPNRILTIEWKDNNFWDNLSIPATENFTFQILIKEADNSFEIIYDGNNFKTNSQIDLIEVGLRNQNDEVLAAEVTPINSYSNPTWTSSTGASALVNQSILPAGVSYSFIPNNVGINEKTEEVLKIYPNPATDMIWVENTSSIFSLQIIDLQGKVVLQKELNQQESRHFIDVSVLPAGQYIVKTNEGSHAVQKINVIR